MHATILSNQRASHNFDKLQGTPPNEHATYKHYSMAFIVLGKLLRERCINVDYATRSWSTLHDPHNQGD